MVVSLYIAAKSQCSDPNIGMTVSQLGSALVFTHGDHLPNPEVFPCPKSWVTDWWLTVSDEHVLSKQQFC